MSSEVNPEFEGHRTQHTCKWPFIVEIYIYIYIFIQLINVPLTFHSFWFKKLFRKMFHTHILEGLELQICK